MVFKKGPDPKPERKDGAQCKACYAMGTNPYYDRNAGDLPDAGKLATWQKVVLGAISAVSLLVAAAPVAVGLGEGCLAAAPVCAAEIVEMATDGASGGSAVVGSGAVSAAAGAGLKENLATGQLANDVVESLRATGKLPSNYVTKTEAAAQGWKPGKALGNKIPGGQIGGDPFHNTDGKLPSANGRVWYEADIGIDSNMTRKKQPGTRLVYSSDGLAYVTGDHYESFYQISNWR
ncbi:ribonuclease domain-containing protein [Streptomyces sp. MBT49]|uniref:ribonuclease domain-containing protein n=1 Tax=Streptomyces sp. MBT49 TaxID=1488380 RepID=UPI0027DB4149|nr:ribonuclease domain-containing protein [Streptomyces sp. MBT49]